MREFFASKPDPVFWSGLGTGMLLSGWRGYSLGAAAFSFFIMLTATLLLWRLFRE